MILAALALAVVACSSLQIPAEIVSIPTQSPPADPNRCMAALVQGQLVADGRWGIAIRESTGNVREVVWPAGYTGVKVGGDLTLRDGEGHDVASAGDWVEISGGELEGGAWMACSRDPVKPWDRQSGHVERGG